MPLSAAEFMRRFLSHVLPNGLQCIRHVGFHANAQRARQIEVDREFCTRG